MISDAAIDQARNGISQLLLEQVANGLQTTSLPQDMAACGQFVGAPGRGQRGAHGTSAALDVLAQSDLNGAPELVKRMISYLEMAWLGSNTYDGANHDKTNVIKIAETLIAVQKVQRSIASTEALARHLATLLITARRQGCGWSYFIDSPNNSDIDELPTAFAYLALSEYGFDGLDITRKWLFEKVNTASQTPRVEGQSDIYVHTYSLYVLSTANARGWQPPAQELKKIFLTFWQRLSGVRDNVEQNLEYWRNETESFYVRVPWQIYLLGLGAKLAPSKILTTTSADLRLSTLVGGASSGRGFRYPHSGDVSSSRTNAILFNVLGIVKIERSRSHWKPVFWLGHRVANILRSRPVAYLFAASVASFIIYSIYLWFNDASKEIADLAVEFIAAILLALLARRNA